MKTNKQVSEQIRQVADYVEENLCRNGCMIHRYDAVSTSSVYLKVDAGVACTVRLSDHEGKSHLAYRFNYLAHVPGSGVDFVNDGGDRYYYQAGALDTMIGDILTLRDERALMYKSYDELVREKIASDESQKGFWQKSWLVTSGPMDAA